MMTRCHIYAMLAGNHIIALSTTDLTCRQRLLGMINRNSGEAIDNKQQKVIPDLLTGTGQKA